MACGLGQMVSIAICCSISCMGLQAIPLWLQHCTACRASLGCSCSTTACLKIGCNECPSACCLST